MQHTTGQVRSFAVPGLPGAEAIIGDGIAHTFRRHMHTTFLIGAVARGERMIEHARGVASMVPGGLFLLNPGQVHACTPGGSATGHSYRILSLAPRLLRTMVLPIDGQDHGYLHFSMVSCPNEMLFTELMLLFSRLEQDGVHGEGGQWVAEFLNLLMRSCRQAGQLGFVRVECRALVRNACAYIREHFSDNIEARILAERSGVSLFHFQREFKKYMGITPHEYMHAYRIFQAKRLLLDCEDIADVAVRVGFFDQSHFTKIFKRAVGISPGTFRKIQQG